MDFKVIFLASLMLLSATTSAIAQDYGPTCEVSQYERYGPQVVHLTFEGDGGHTGHSGSASWLSSNLLLTSGRVVDGGALGETWQQLTLRWSDESYALYQLYESQLLEEDGEHSAVVQGRLAWKSIPVEGEYIAVIEIDAPIGTLEQFIKLWDLPDAPKPGDPIFGVLYADANAYWPQLRYTAGHVFKPWREPSEHEQKTALNPELLWMEVTRQPDGRSRDVANEASSGAPIFDCAGVLVGVVMSHYTQGFAVGNIATVPTAAGVPNLMAVRIHYPTRAALNRLATGQ